MADPRLGYKARALPACPSNPVQGVLVFDEDAGAFRIMVHSTSVTRQSADTYGSEREAVAAWYDTKVELAVC